MPTSNHGAKDGPGAPDITKEQLPPADRITLPTERQRFYLRLVFQHRSPKEIAAATGSNHRAVDKHLLQANNLMGVKPLRCRTPARRKRGRGSALAPCNHPTFRCAHPFLFLLLGRPLGRQRT